MNQRIAFVICFIIGLFLGGTNSFTDWLHEEGHEYSYRQDGIPAKIVSPTLTMSARITPHGLAAGAMSEFSFFFAFVVLFFCISNPEKEGIRKIWAHIGIPFGACNTIFFKALLYTDFNREYAAEIAPAWIAVILMILIPSWLIISVFRIFRKA